MPTSKRISAKFSALFVVVLVLGASFQTHGEWSVGYDGDLTVELEVRSRALDYVRGAYPYLSRLIAGDV